MRKEHIKNLIHIRHVQGTEMRDLTVVFYYMEPTLNCGNKSLSLHGWAQNWILRFGPTTWITQLKYNDQGSFICVEYNWSDFNFAKCNGRVSQR